MSGGIEIKDIQLSASVTYDGSDVDLSGALLGERIFVNYRLTDKKSGRGLDEVGRANYTVSMELKKPDGTTASECSYNNDGNWIAATCDQTGYYTYTVRVNGDVEGSAHGSVYVFSPKLSPFFTYDSSETILKKAYLCDRIFLNYTITDPAGGKGLDALVDKDYTVNMVLRKPDGSVSVEANYCNDGNWISVVCDQTGVYTYTITVSGALNGSVSGSIQVVSPVGGASPEEKASYTMDAYLSREGSDERLTAAEFGETVYLNYFIYDETSGSGLESFGAYEYNVHMTVWYPDGTAVCECSKQSDGGRIAIPCRTSGIYTYEVTAEGDISFTKSGTLLVKECRHSWNSGVVTKAATCNDAGVKTYTCTRCNETRTEAITKLDHNPVSIPAVAATCTKTGLTEGSKCSRCGTILTTQQTTPAFGHSLTYAVSAAPTTAQSGTLTGTCSRCGEKVSVALPALDTVNYTRTVVREAGTTQTGLERYTWKSTAYGSFCFEVETAMISGIMITKQPMNITGINGTSVKFSVAASGIGLSYQWQYSTDGAKFYNSSAAGAKTAELTISANDTNNGRYYRCVVTNTAGDKIISKAARLTVSAPPVVITTQPVNISAENGSKAVFKIVAGGTGLSYQWQYSVDGAKFYNSSADGAKTAELTVSANDTNNGRYYRCVITAADGTKVTSNAARLTVKASAEGTAIKSQPESTMAASGTTAVFCVTAVGTGLSYQWQYSVDGAKFYTSSAAGAKTAELTISANSTNNNRWYRVVITDASGTKLTSDAAQLIVF